jgi:hypothetical protein
VTRQIVSKEAVTITQNMGLYTEELEKSNRAARARQTLSKYEKEPEVAAAAKELRAVLDDNERRLLRTFNQ